MRIVEQYLLQLKTEKRRWWRAAAILTALSLLVALGVSWNLRLTGITIANGATCGCEEHQHDQDCPWETVLICGYDTEGQSAEEDETAAAVTESAEDSDAESVEAPFEEQPTENENEETSASDGVEETADESGEAQTDGADGSDTAAEDEQAVHIHTEECYQRICVCSLQEHIHQLSCYSDSSADVETSEIWEASLPELTGEPSQDVVLIAESQLGCGESEDNFEVDADGETKHGITRYGQWYGNPYGDWANMFTSFCLRYGGLYDVPVNSGAEVMRLGWEENDSYRQAGQYEASGGDILFLDKNENGTADTTAVITERDGQTVTVIEGDVDSAVARVEYSLDDTRIMGYGVTSPRRTLMLSANAVSSGEVIATVTDYDSSLLVETNSFVLYTQSAGRYYAFDGNGAAVEIFIDSNGKITSDAEDPNMLLWSFSSTGQANAYVICNVSSGRYMHAYPNNGSGVTTSGAYSSTVVETSSGIKIRSNTEYAALDVENGVFVMTQSQNDAASYSFGVTSRCTVWLDGTNGGLMSLMGSDNTAYTVETGETVRLPEQWRSPEKYSYVLKGWYDVKNGRYYAPGTEIEVEENFVFYADWGAATYDVGEYNAFVTDTVSTSDFITTHIFDYNPLFNVLSQSVSVNVTASGHTETWNQVTSGTVPYQNGQTLDFDFLDYDGSGDISYPNNRNSNNASGTIYEGLYSDELAEILFDTGNSYNAETGTGIIGKQYIGTADHLFQKNNDPTDEFFGYYYYDSKLNAASYNRSDGRFYVYEYLERTADSEKDGGDGGYSDFLPFNSPYANTNGKLVNDYNYAGEKGEYASTVHYQYDAKYNSNNNSTDHVGTNYHFGMSMDIAFYLPNDPGALDVNGATGNRDVYGNEMHFYFSGDDDVWVLLDGKLILDLGGVHGIEDGNINFSTGTVTANGVQTGTLEGTKAGEHVLTVYYLERGSSQSNCSISFNLAPRFTLTIQKEDVLTQEVLDGAQFSVYSDVACTEPCELWSSEASYKNGDAPTNTFTITDGKAQIWGLSSSNTYYIRETHPPDMESYVGTNGIICLTLDNNGFAYYSVEIIEETDENGNKVPVSNGFTVHGFEIDEENQTASIIVTNAQEWVKEITSVYVEKKWDDTEDHSGDTVTVYLNITDPDGTVRKIREILLGEANGWKHTWINLPKYERDGVTEIQYSVSEAYLQGYSPTVEKLENGTVTETTWVESYTFRNGGVYVLQTSSGCLSAESETGNTLCFVDAETAKESPLALWTATVSGSYVRLTNQNGQTLNLNYSSLSSRRYFNAISSTSSYQNLTPVQTSTGVRLYYRYSSRYNYYICGLNSSGYASASTSSSSALTFNPLEKTVTTTTYEYDGYAYSVTNVPLEEETSLKVTKKWDHPTGNQSLYEKEQITVKLLANGVDTGRTVTLTLKNGWTDTFMGLPYVDDGGNIIEYTVEESWETQDWIAIYGEVVTVDADTPTYETTVTNVYRWGSGVELPETGGTGNLIYILCGTALAAGPLVYGFRQRRKNGRRSKE